MSALRLERAAGYAVVTLDRPEAKNALSRELRLALRTTFDTLAADADVRVVILTGAGSTFCAGLDLREIGENDALLQAALAEESVVTAMGRFEGPIIGAITGHAITGGLELALGCDVLIAGESAVFADTHGSVGLLPIWGLSQKLSRTVGVSRAKEMSLTGTFVGAPQALAWGLVNHVVPDADLLARARKMAVDMLDLAPGMLAAYKRLIDVGFGIGLDAALALEQNVATANNLGISSAAIAARRGAILARGRRQR